MEAKETTSPKMGDVRPAEEYVNTPLKPEVKAALLARAAENGRVAGREAALIITRCVMRNKCQERG